MEECKHIGEAGAEGRSTRYMRSGGSRMGVWRGMVREGGEGE